MKREFAAAALLCGVTLSACYPAGGQTEAVPVWAREETIEALGRAYVEMPPTQAEFSVTYRAQAETSAEAGALATMRANLATETILALSDGTARVTSQLEIEPYFEQVTVRAGEFEEELAENRHPDALLGYVALAVVEVETDNIDQVALLRGGAMAVGPAEATPVRFELEPSAANQRIAFEAAVADAVDRAAIVARVSGGQLGPLLVLREGATSCLGQEYGAPGVDEDRSTRSRMEGFLTITGSRIHRGVTELLATTNVTDEALRAGTVDAATIIAAAEDFSLSADYDVHRVQARVCAIFAVD